MEDFLKIRRKFMTRTELQYFGTFFVNIFLGPLLMTANFIRMERFSAKASSRNENVPI